MMDKDFYKETQSMLLLIINQDLKFIFHCSLNLVHKSVLNLHLVYYKQIVRVIVTFAYQIKSVYNKHKLPMREMKMEISYIKKKMKVYPL